MPHAYTRTLTCRTCEDIHPYLDMCIHTRIHQDMGTHTHRDMCVYTQGHESLSVHVHTHAQDMHTSVYMYEVYPGGILPCTMKNRDIC